MNVIKLTRLRHEEPFFVNPDLIERVDTHVDTVVRLTSGTEFVVSQTGDEIVRLIADFRARVIALAGIFQDAASGTANNDPTDTGPTRAEHDRAVPVAELGRSEQTTDDIWKDDVGQPQAPSGAPNNESVQR